MMANKYWLRLASMNLFMSTACAESQYFLYYTCEGNVTSCDISEVMFPMQEILLNDCTIITNGTFFEYAYSETDGIVAITYSDDSCTNEENTGTLPVISGVMFAAGGLFSSSTNTTQ